MYIPTPVSEMERGQKFVYDMKILVVVKVEQNLLGDYDVWAKFVGDPRRVPDHHLVFESNAALMRRT